MSLLTRLREIRTPSHGQAGASDKDNALAALRDSERLLRAGAAVDIIQAAAAGSLEADLSGDRIASAWRSLFQGDIDAALRDAYASAEARPYDVDSRIVHGVVRLARNELEHAAHEFDQVIEEFGAEPDAADGRRAVILARGHAPLDDLPADEEEWRQAAVLLSSLWRVAGVADARLAGLNDAHPEGLALLRQALQIADGDGHL